MSLVPLFCLFGPEKKNAKSKVDSHLHQPRGVTTTVRMRTISPRHVAAIDSCFCLVY